MKYKGPTVMNEQERYAAVRQCKWVDECVEAVPYVTSVEMVRKYGVHYVVHGEDITYDEHGNCSYSDIMDAGMFLLIQRTRGVSTTEIVGRMLSMVKTTPEGVIAVENNKDIFSDIPSSPKSRKITQQYMDGVLARPGQWRVSPYEKPKKLRFLPTARKITEFALPVNKPKSTDKIVYVDGGFDMFHVGHAEFLRKCKELGDYLIVGLHEDWDIKYHKGEHYPIMNLHERCLNVLACRYVDDVIIGSPFIVTDDLIEAYDVDVVCHGSVYEQNVEKDPYKIAKERGIFVTVESPLTNLTTSVIVKRIVQNAREYELRNRKKLEKDQQHSGKYVEEIVE